MKNRIFFDHAAAIHMLGIVNNHAQPSDLTEMFANNLNDWDLPGDQYFYKGAPGLDTPADYKVLADKYGWDKLTVDEKAALRGQFDAVFVDESYNDAVEAAVRNLYKDPENVGYRDAVQAVYDRYWNEKVG